MRGNSHIVLYEISKTDNYNNFKVEKADLQNALKRVGLLVDKKSPRIYLDIKPGRLTITSQETEIGTAKEEIPCSYDGEEIVVAVSYVHLEEPLKVMNVDRLTFEFTEKMKALTLKPEPAEDYFHIIMPMQME